jgi:acetyl-CoA C-acetyltransferase
MNDTDTVVVAAVRSPIGKRDGALATMHAADLLGAIQRACVEQAGVEPKDVDQVIAGCVGQVGEQSSNIARTAWLAAGLPISTPASTVDSQCGSSQQAFNLAAALVGSGVAEVVMACGVEAMSRVPMGSNVRNGPGRAISKSYFARFEFTTQFEGAERIARRWHLSRDVCDRFGFESQQRAQRAWEQGAFDSEVQGIDAPNLGDDGKPDGTTHRVDRDEGLRETSLEAPAKLKPVVGEEGIHTAGSSSQISDGASAAIIMSARRAAELGVRSRAKVRSQCLVGTDPVLMLTGPIDATRLCLQRANVRMRDLGTVEINEAFASVVLAWEREIADVDMSRVNPNGGAIALGHPLGASGVRLVTTALHSLERLDEELALVTMCCGGGLGTGTVLERVRS